MPQEHTVIRIFDSLQGIQGQTIYAGLPHDKMRIIVSLLEEMKLNALLELQKGAKKMTPEQAKGVQNLFNI